MLSWGFATEGCVSAGGLMVRKQITKKVKGAKKTKKGFKNATVMQSRKSNVDLAALTMTKSAMGQLLQRWAHQLE